MKNILATIVFVMTTSLNAETLSVSSFQIEIEDGWEHSIENGPGDDRGSVISLRRLDGVGILKMGSFNVPGVVSEDILRNMTNLELSIPLTWQNWGDYSGYQYSYVESGLYHRQWWLTNQRTVIFITYQCDPESKDIETEEIDRIVRSLTVNNA
jgi:hypothetical protein